VAAPDPGAGRESLRRELLALLLVYLTLAILPALTGFACHG
jgi:hypothetical protein